MAFPESVKLSKQLTVQVHLHEFFLGDRDRLCWTYLTDGFNSLGQKEMALSLLLEDEDSTLEYPKTPIRLFQLLADRISEKRHVDYGDSHRLGQKGIFGFTGAYYLPAIQFSGIPSLDNFLAVILVHEEEFNYARQYGLTRYLSRLGKYCSSFPYPTWNTAARPSMFKEGAIEESLLSNAQVVNAEHSHVELRGSQILLQLHQRDSEPLADHLRTMDEDATLVINCAYSPGCDASLFWEPGQTEPGAFAAPTKSTGTTGGSFLAIRKADASNADISEDGFSVSLKAADWKVLVSAIENHTSMTAPLEGGGVLALKFIFKAPGDTARVYQPNAVWKKFGAGSEPGED